VKRLDVGNCRTISFPPMHTHGAGFAQFNGDDSRRRVRAEEQRVLLKFHCETNFLSFRAKSRNLLIANIQRCLDFDRNDKKMQSAKSVDINSE
jgi:hypothetical protein